MVVCTAVPATRDGEVRGPLGSKSLKPVWATVKPDLQKKHDDTLGSWDRKMRNSSAPTGNLRTILETWLPVSNKKEKKGGGEKNAWYGNITMIKKIRN